MLYSNPPLAKLTCEVLVLCYIFVAMCETVKPSCDQCGKTFASNSALCKHSRTVHDTQPETGKIPRSEASGSFQCYVCDRTFAKKWSVTRHLKDIHNVEHHEEVSEKVSAFQCSLCSKSYQQKKDLNKHIKLKHTGESRPV